MTWSSQALLGRLWSKVGRVSLKHRVLQGLFAQNEMVMLQVAFGTLADLTIPTSHRYFCSFGDLGAEEACSLAAW